MTPLQVGARAEGAVLAALVQDGRTVLLPFGVARYDLVLEQENGTFTRVQCKSGSLRDGVVNFKRGNYTNDEVDAFGVYCHELRRVYLIPFSDAYSGSLRVTPAKNGQQRRTHDAAKYEV